LEKTQQRLQHLKDEYIEYLSPGVAKDRREQLEAGFDKLHDAYFDRLKSGVGAFEKNAPEYYRVAQEYLNKVNSHLDAFEKEMERLKQQRERYSKDKHRNESVELSEGFDKERWFYIPGSTPDEKQTVKNIMAVSKKLGQKTSRMYNKKGRTQEEFNWVVGPARAWKRDVYNVLEQMHKMSNQFYGSVTKWQPHKARFISSINTLVKRGEGLLQQNFSRRNESVEVNEESMTDKEKEELAAYRAKTAKAQEKKKSKEEEKKKWAKAAILKADLEKAAEPFWDKRYELESRASYQKKQIRGTAREEAKKTGESYRAVYRKLLDKFYDEWIPKLRGLNKQQAEAFQAVYTKHEALTPEMRKQLENRYPVGGDDDLEDDLERLMDDYAYEQARRD
jgi:hypothetical protein